MLEINYINSCNNIWDFLSGENLQKDEKGEHGKKARPCVDQNREKIVHGQIPPSVHSTS